MPQMKNSCFMHGPHDEDECPQCVEKTGRLAAGSARKKPTIAELEAIFDEEGVDSVVMLPNGEIRAVKSSEQMSLALQVALVVAVVDAQKYFEAGGHILDLQSLSSVFGNPEFKAWVEQLKVQGQLPVIS